MKKTMALALLLLAGLVGMTGCTPVQAQEIQTSFENVRSILVDVRDQTVEVALAQGEQTTVAYWETETEGFDLTVSQQGEMRMTANYRKTWKDYFGGKQPKEQRKIALNIPQAALDTLTIRTTNGDVTLPKLALAEALTVQVNNGHISFEEVDAGKAVSLTVKNGNITGTLSGGWDDYAIQCKSKKGETNLPESKAGGEKMLTVEANNGDVTIQFAK